MTKNNKALILFSGGLDSMLVVKMLQKQKLNLVGLTFTSYFFDAKQAKKAAKELKLELRVIDVAKEHLALVEKPKHGYGKNMNPCLDCRILMLRQARKIMAEEDFDFVVTGEVLKERPMTQSKPSMKLVEKEAGLQGFLLRPLSAKLLQITIPEEEKWVDRNKLEGIVGRSRKEQMKLAGKHKLKDYPNPAGGCILTDPEFSLKLKKLLTFKLSLVEKDIELLKNGRQFFQEGAWLIVGRNEKEDKKIKTLMRKGDFLIEMENYPGPVILGHNLKAKQKIFIAQIEEAKKIIIRYSAKAQSKKDIKFKIIQK
jgi:tRNA U34 2-thiouridine synthase MnmA/TrmU